jgi:hypothetical protein
MELLTPSALAKSTPVKPLEVPSYDWDKQQRWEDRTIYAGKYTVNSIQTFDSQGKPRDSQNDNND